MDREDWNRRYEGKELLWSQGPNRFLVEEAGELPPGRALDLAAGEGRNAIWLASRGWRVEAVDFSDVALERAAKLAETAGVRITFTRADLETWIPEEGAFDLVLFLYLHLPPDRMKRVLVRGAEALAPGGTLLLVGHDRTNLDGGHGGPRDPAILYVPEEIVAALPGLKIVTAERRRRPVETEEGSREAIDCLVRAQAVA